MAKIFDGLKSRIRRITGGMDRYQEAVTFAEAGQTDHAQQLVQKDEPPRSQGKLLVVGRESVFTEKVVDYALDMARRLSYEILALNTAPLSCATFELLPAERSKICQEFEALTRKNIEQFKREAQKREIPFTHVIKFSEKDQALAEITREFRDIEFVISDTEENRAAERASQGERPAQEIYVYSMV